MSYSSLPNPYGVPDPILANIGGPINSATNVNAFSNISVAGIEEDDSFYTFALSGFVLANFPAALVTAVGCAVSVDPTAPTTAKLCVVNDIILGVLKTIEYRAMEGFTCGAVMTEGGHPIPYDTGSPVPAIGDSVQGSPVAGKVMKLAAAHGRSNVVTAVDVVKNLVTVLFL